MQMYDNLLLYNKKSPPQYSDGLLFQRNFITYGFSSVKQERYEH